MADAVDSFRRATDAMRDTTKWLVTIVPGASLATVIAQISPALSAVHTNSAAFGGLVELLIAAVLAVVITVVAAAYVLAAPVSGLGDAIKMADPATPPGRGVVRWALRRPAPASFVDSIDEQGVLRLYGYKADSFFLALAEEPSTDENLQAATTVIADIAAHRQTQERFLRFSLIWALMLGVVLSAGVLAERIHAAAQTVHLTLPAPVGLVPTPLGRAVLTNRGCSTTEGTPVAAWIIKGDLDTPAVITDAPHCTGIRLQWKPTWGSVVPGNHR